MNYDHLKKYPQPSQSNQKADVVINIAGYKFFRIPDPHAIRDTLKEYCRQIGLKGTIIIGKEGINSSLAGTRKTLDSYYEYIYGTLNFPEIEYKESISTDAPFTRMLVKVKKEIISMGHDDIYPDLSTGDYIEAVELKNWYEQKKDFVILDTRNDYEIKLGKFKDAQELDIKSFREFPDKVEALKEELKDKEVVTYCTGGIRCEKATAYMKDKLGIKKVYQLKGGILKYFEDCKNDFYEGECFVFDKRVGVDHELNETDTTQCYACRSPLTKEDLLSPEYLPSQTCPYCHDAKGKKAPIEEYKS